MSQKHSLLLLLSLYSFLILCAGEHKRHRLSAICIPETHEANLHKSSAIMRALRVLRTDLWLMLPSTGVEPSSICIIKWSQKTDITLFFSFFKIGLVAFGLWLFIEPPDTYRVYSNVEQCTHTGSHMPRGIYTTAKAEFLPICYLWWQFRAFFSKHYREFRPSVCIH